MRRGVVPLLLLLSLLALPSGASAQISQRRVEGYMRVVREWFDSKRMINHPEWRSLPDGSDPEAARLSLRKELDQHPEFAAFYCGLMKKFSERPPNFRSEWAVKLQTIMTEECRAHPPLPLTADELKLVERPLSTPLANLLYAAAGKVSSERHLPSAAIYVPKPYDVKVWAQTPDVIDYRAALQGAFASDPLEIAWACKENYGDPLTPPVGTLAEYRRIFVEECDAFPLDPVRAAVKRLEEEELGIKGQKNRLWLAGIVNTKIEESTALSEPKRRERFELLLRGLKNENRNQQSFFDLIESFTLRPADPRTLPTLAKYAYLGFFPATQVGKADIVEVLTQQSEHARTLDPTRAVEWTRAERDLLFAAGRFSEAERLSQGLLKSRAATDRDRILSAAIHRALGQSAEFDRLLAKCPPPDEAYIAAHGKSEQAATYCRDVIGELAGSGIELFESKPPAGLVDLVAVVNRVKPPAVNETAARVLSESTEYLTKIEKALAAGLAQAAAMTPAQRLNEGIALMYECSACQRGLHLPALRPYDDRSVYIALRSANTFSRDPRVDIDYSIRAALQAVIDRERKGANGSDWKRADRALALFSGEYDRARVLSTELLAEKRPGHVERDRVMSAFIEQIFGNSKPYVELINHCPPASDEYRRLYPDSDVDYCRSVGVGIALRLAHTRKRETPRVALEILQKAIDRGPASSDERYGQVDALIDADPVAGERELTKLLESPDRRPDREEWLLEQLTGLASARHDDDRALELIAQRLRLAGVRDPGFDPSSWQKVAAQPMFSGCYLCAEHDSLLETFAQIAARAGRFELAQRVIEARLTNSLKLADTGKIRRALLGLAAEQTTRDRVGMQRILAYLKPQPLSTSEKEEFDRLLMQTGLDLSGPTPATPWDSLTREPRGVPPGTPGTDI
jgi:hypothetical protein